MTKKTITTFNDLVDNWTERMMELDHKVTANRSSIDGLEKQIDETYKEMENIEKAAHDLLGDKVQFNLYENEDNAIRISYKSSSMSEPLVNIVKDRKIQTGKKPNKSEMYFFSEEDTNLSDEQLASIISMSEHEIEQKVIGKDGSHSSIKQGFIGVDEYGKPIQGLKVSVGNTNSEEEPEVHHYKVRVPESATEESDEGVQCQTVYGHLSRESDENTSDKIPVLSKEDDKTTKPIIEMVSHLDENYLNRLRANLDGTYVYDMEDFHALVTQLFILQEAEKAKNTEKEVR